jgi:hypothetical protein
MPTYAVTLTAQGVPLNYGSLNGTSMATPLVTGLAALMWSRHPGFAHTKIKQCLQDTAVKLGSGTFNNSWGHGRVDALAALKCGDVVLPPSLIKASCPTPLSTLLVMCPSRIKVSCQIESRLTLCRSKLPNLCPTSKIPELCPTPISELCPISRLDAVCPTPISELCPSRVGALCGPDSRLCPSALDACPSSLGCGPVIDPVIRTLLAQLADRLRQVEAERWQSVPDDVSGAVPDDAEWYYLDDDGGAHGWP